MSVRLKRRNTQMSCRLRVKIHWDVDFYITARVRPPVIQSFLLLGSFAMTILEVRTVSQDVPHDHLSLPTSNCRLSPYIMPSDLPKLFRNPQKTNARKHAGGTTQVLPSAAPLVDPSQPPSDAAALPAQNTAY